jgi:hypothetical protein
LSAVKIAPRSTAVRLSDGPPDGILNSATKRNTVTLRKTAIAIPDDLLEAVDRAAEARQESRNRFITYVLRMAVRARRDAEITRRLNDCFAGPELAATHRTDAEILDAAGTDWSDERW